MKPTLTPMAAWLVRNVACTSDYEALAGDIAEYLHQGRTALWQWKQVIFLVAVSTAAQIRRAPLAVLRAVIGGWLIYWPLGYAIFHFGLYQVTLDSLDLDNPDLLIGSWAPPIWYHTARFGTTYTFAANAIATALLAVIGLLTGWIVARHFRPHLRAALIVLSGTVLLSWIGYSATLSDSAAGARLPWSLYFWINSALQSIGILYGGARGARA